MIINRRRLMGNNGLPYDAEIEYLKSNGTQWIDTTWTPDLTKDFRIESYAGWVTNERGMFISSFRNENNLSIELYNNRRLRVYAGKSDVVVSDTQSSLNTLYSITIEYISSSGRCTVIIDENSFIGKTNTAARILNTEAAALGTDKTHRFPYGMFGAIKIYNPNLILDLIPVRVGTTGYMYDKVSKQLFGNSGTGDFILGPDKYDAEIEYLESSGTQYIQLPLSVSSSSYFEVGGTVLTLYPNNNNYSIFGSNPYKQMMAEFYSYYSSTNENMYTSMVGGNSNSGGWRGKVGEKTDFAISTTFIKSSETIRELIRPLTDNITGFRIFASYKNDNRYPVRFCGFYIKVDDANVYDFIPVRVGQTGYLYDKVSGRLFGNAGTGKFILGSDIIMTSTSNPEVLAVCYALGWCASPNYMTKAEAEAVTDIGIVFRSNTSITHFEELQYFNITIIKSSAFQSCTNLERVIIPQGVTTIEASAFYGNQKLSSINLGNIQNINALAFYNCNLSSVDISNCLSLGGGVFYKCINLTNIGSVASVTTIDSSTNGTFQDTGLQGSISFQKLQGTNIPKALFSGCQHITSVDFPTLLYTSVGANAFWKCGFVSFAVREGCTTANNHSFSSEYLEYIDLPSSFTTWNDFALWQNKNQKVIVCRATTPPTVGNTTGGQKSFDGIPTTCKLYVPQASISLYEAAAGWDRFAGRFLPIEGSWYETHREIDPNDE